MKEGENHQIDLWADSVELVSCLFVYVTDSRPRGGNSVPTKVTGYRNNFFREEQCNSVTSSDGENEIVIHLTIMVHSVRILRKVLRRSRGKKSYRETFYCVRLPYDTRNDKSDGYINDIRGPVGEMKIRILTIKTHTHKHNTRVMYCI